MHTIPFPDARLIITPHLMRSISIPPPPILRTCLLQRRFIETLIQEIQDAPVQLDQPPATDQQPRQNKRWSVHAPPLEIYFREEEEATPEQEKAAIARYRREKFSIPEHEWWKLESKHRIALAALGRMEDDEAMDDNQSELPSPMSSETPFVHKNGGLDTKSALRPEVQEALGFSHTPDPQAVRPVGENGLDLENPAQVAPSLARPPDCNPEAWEHWQHLDGVTDYQRHAYIGARLSAYSFENGDIFNIQDSRVRQRLHHVEKCWQQGKAAMNIETQFWNAVYERQYQPNDFSHRDAYLLLANAVEFAANMLVYGRSESDIHSQKFNRYLTTAFDCPKEDQDGSSLDIPELSNTLLKFVPGLTKSPVQEEDSLHDTTKRLGSLRVG